MSSLIQSMTMGTPTGQRSRAAANWLHIVLAGIGFALSSSHHAYAQLVALMLMAASFALVWRGQRQRQAEIERLSAREASWGALMAGSQDGIVMVEAGAKEVTEAQVVGALEAAHAAIKQIVAVIEELKRTAGKKKLQVQKKEIGKEFYREVEEKVLVPLTDAMRIRGKLENYETVDLALKDLVASLPDGEVERKLEAKAIFKELKEKVLRDEVLHWLVFPEPMGVAGIGSGQVLRLP